MNDRSGFERPASQRAKTAQLPPGIVADGARRKILEASLRLFATEGFHAASIRDIVRLAELQASAVYAHFPSKEHILAELARVGHEAHFNALQAALLETGNDPVAQLRAFVQANAVLHASYPFVAIVVNAEMRALSDDLAGPALALRKQSTALLVQILERGIKMKRFDVPALEVAAAAMGAMAIRIPYWYSPQGGLGVQELADAQATLALRMVGAAT